MRATLAAPSHLADAEVAVLLVSELATNAVLHARTDYEVRVSIADDAVRVEVRDDNPRLPIVTEVPLDALSGRGLNIVKRAADAWGIDQSPTGKTVWFEVSRSRQPRPQPGLTSANI